MIPSVVAVLLALMWAMGRRRGRSLEHATNARFARDPDGVIVGAQSIALDAGGDRAVLLVHGAGDTPQSLSKVAAALHERGYTVRAPLLPGHGRSLRELAAHSGDEWYSAVQEALADLRRLHHCVGVVGLSMGGALSVRLAAEHEDVPALVLLSPYLGMPSLAAAVIHMSALWGWLVPYVSTASEHSVLDPVARSEGLAYGAMSVRSLRELLSVATRGFELLPKLTVPTLVIQSRTDNRVSSELTTRAFDRIGARDKRIEWIEGAGHVITVDRGWEGVAASTAQWLESHCTAQRDATAPR
jgi:carboxylesterase